MTVTVVGLYGYKTHEHEIDAEDFKVDPDTGMLTVFDVGGQEVAAFASGSWASVVSS
jgi:hypothetical protein